MYRFNTFKALITLLIVGVLLVTTLAFMAFTRQEVTQAMLASSDESARNVLQAVNLSITAQFQDMQFFRQYALEHYQQQLRNNVQIALATIDRYRRQAQEGKLSEPHAQELALQYISGLTYGSNDYCFVYDSNQVAIAHPDPTIYGRDMSGVKDMKGQMVEKIMRDSIRTNGSGYCSLWWHRLGQTEPVEKLLYYVYYPKWAWIVGSGIYIDDIEADAQNKMRAIMETLKATFARTKVLESGCFWLFDGRRAILIPPRFAEGSATDALFSEPGTNLFLALVGAARNPDRPYYHQAPARSNRRAELICSRVLYFAPLDWYIVASVDTSEMWRPVQQILWKQTVFSVILVLLFILLALWLVNHVTRPLARLTSLADQLQQNNFSLPAGASAEFQTITFPRELGRLARTIDSLVQKLQEYLKHLAESTAARERAESELRIAHDIQMSMLPDRLPELATRSGIDLHAALIPASAVGGDLYDFFMLDDRRLCVIVGDVSDKGVPAALFMARSKALLRVVAAEHPRPDRILTKVNEELCQGNKLFMFVTVFLGIIDTQTFEMAFSNAGHLSPYLLQPGGACAALTLTPHKPLGIVSRVQYTVNQLVLAPGAGCFIYTDGITEAVNAREEMFGSEHLQATLARLTESGARETVEAVLQAVNGFAGGIPQNDDIAALALRRLP